MSDIASRVKAIIADNLDVEETEVTPEAVSYTHLDVYKRQELRCIIDKS